MFYDFPFDHISNEEKYCRHANALNRVCMQQTCACVASKQYDLVVGINNVLSNLELLQYFPFASFYNYVLELLL